MLNELRTIRNIFIRIGAAFIALALALLAVPVFGQTVALRAVEVIRNFLLPQGATLVVLSPIDPFLAQATLAGMLAFALCVPLIFFELWRYAAPGLTGRESALLGGGLFIALLLAALGGAFAYFLLVPLMFSELFAFLPAGVMPFFSLREVISLSAGFTLGCALLFLLPLCMALLSAVGVVPAGIWRAWTRPAVLLVLVICAIITPDGSGVGMMLLAAPICGLYAVGYGASAWLGRGALPDN